MIAATAILVGPIVVNLISKEDRIVLGLRKKPFEPDSLAKWAELCVAGGRVIDIGAYTGIYSIAARKLGAQCIAFEPLPANRARFRENCRLNGVHDGVNSEAVSDRCGEGVLRHSDVAFTSGASLVRDTGRRWPVGLVTIDSLALKRVHAIKIDVERAEPMVLRGARETLAAHRPVLLVEVLGEAEGAAVLEAMDGLGYVHEATLDGRNWLMVP